LNPIKDHATVRLSVIDSEPDHHFKKSHIDFHPLIYVRTLDPFSENLKVIHYTLLLKVLHCPRNKERNRLKFIPVQTDTASFQSS